MNWHTADDDRSPEAIDKEESGDETDPEEEGPPKRQRLTLARENTVPRRSCMSFPRPALYGSSLSSPQRRLHRAVSRWVHL